MDGIGLLAAAAIGGSAGRSGVAPGCGAFPMRIAADGTWFHEERPIRRPELVRLFAKVLRREEDGRYWLVTPYERGTIAVDDSPFTAVAVDREGEGRSQRLVFTTNLGERVPLDAAHPLTVTQGPENSGPRPYILVRDGLAARLLRPVFYELVNLGEEWGAEPTRAGTRYGVWSDMTFFPLD